MESMDDGEPAPMSVSAAVRTIERATSLVDTIRRRAEGVTWMVWGLVTALVALFYAFSDYYVQTVTGDSTTDGVTTWNVAQGPPWSAYLDFAWPAWILVGMAMTYAVWRTAAVTVPEIRTIGTRIVVAVSVTVGAFLLAWLLLVRLSADVRPNVGLALLGIPWLALGGLNTFRTTTAGRRAMLAIGATLFVAGLLSRALIAGLHGSVAPAVELLAIVIGGGVPFVVGLWQGLRS